MRGHDSQPPKVAGSRQEFWRGIRDMLPILLGVIPFGLIFGALALAEGVPPLATQGLSLFVFAGSAQFIAAGLIGAGAPPTIVVLTILVVNLRHMLYSATMAPYYEKLPLRWKAGLAWLLTDEAFATTSVRYREPDQTRAHWYALGAGMALWVSWQVSTAVGVLAGAQVPEAWALDFALPLTFLALLIPVLVSRPAWAAALTAAATSLALIGLPFKLGLLFAIAAGVAAGIGLDTVQERLRLRAEGGG